MYDPERLGDSSRTIAYYIAHVGQLLCVYLKRCAPSKIISSSSTTSLYPTHKPNIQPQYNDDNTYNTIHPKSLGGGLLLQIAVCWYCCCQVEKIMMDVTAKQFLNASKFQIMSDPTASNCHGPFWNKENPSPLIIVTPTIIRVHVTYPPFTQEIETVFSCGTDSWTSLLNKQHCYMYNLPGA